MLVWDLVTARRSPPRPPNPRAVPPPIAAGGSCARSTTAVGAEAGSPSGPGAIPEELALVLRESLMSHNAIVPSLPQLAKTLPPFPSPPPPPSGLTHTDLTLPLCLRKNRKGTAVSTSHSRTD